MTSPVTMTDAVRQSILYQLNNVHTALPAAIVSYDYTKQKASVQPLLNKVWMDGTTQPMPILENVPVIFPRAGGASLTFPVVEGDTCLLIFIERSIDLWLAQGGQVNPDDPRKFDLSDGVALMGLFPYSENSQATNNSDVLLTYNGSSIRIKQSGAVVIETANTVAIGTPTVELIQTLITLLNSFTAFTGSYPYPGVAAAGATAVAQLTTIQGTIP